MTTVETLVDHLLTTQMVDARDIARVLGTTPRSVAGWARDDTTPQRPDEERLLELEAALEVLRQVMRGEPARLWLQSPVPALDDDEPMDLIERGEYRRVIGAIRAIGEGVTA
jgi:transcriptional regulator with XRE-family HTH domain